jgi:hypothetical protein
LSVFTQSAPQEVSPMAQAATQVLPVQTMPEAQAWSQAPQLAASSVRLTQASPHEVVPAPQPVSGATQTLLLQVHPVGQSLVDLQVICTSLLQLAPRSPTMSASMATPAATKTWRRRGLLRAPADGAGAIGSR